MMKDFKFFKSIQNRRVYSSNQNILLTVGNAFNYLIFPLQESEVRLPFIWLANDIMRNEYRLDCYQGPIVYFKIFYRNKRSQLELDESSIEYLPISPRIHSIDIDDYSIPELTDWEFISNDTYVRIYFKIFTR